MAEHNDSTNTLDFIAPDGSFQEKLLDYTANSLEDDAALGKRSDVTVWNKFGYNLDVDTASEELIASYGGSINIMTSADTLDVVSSSTNDTAAGTGVRAVYIIGIDENSVEQEELVSMNGTTPVTTSNQWLGINRVYAISAGSGGSAAGTITIDDTSNSVGVQATIPQGSNVTQQCLFHVPISKTFLAKWLVLNGRKLSGGGGSPRITFKGYSYSRVTGMTYEIFRAKIDTDVENNIEYSPNVPFPVGGREVLYFTATTDTNNTAVNCRFSGTLHTV